MELGANKIMDESIEGLVIHSSVYCSWLCMHVTGGSAGSDVRLEVLRQRRSDAYIILVSKLGCLVCVVVGCLLAADGGGELIRVSGALELCKRATGVVLRLLRDVGVVDRRLVAACNLSKGVNITI